MTLPRRRFLHLAAGAAVLPAASRIARAQAYPSRPVRIIVPFPEAKQPTPSRASWVNRCRSGLGSHSYFADEIEIELPVERHVHGARQPDK